MIFLVGIPSTIFLMGQNVQGGGAMPKSLEHIFQDFYHFRLFQSAGMENFFKCLHHFGKTFVNPFLLFWPFKKNRKISIKKRVEKSLFLSSSL